jgi:hypothetical protein
MRISKLLKKFLFLINCCCFDNESRIFPSDNENVEPSENVIPEHEFGTSEIDTHDHKSDVSIVPIEDKSGASIDIRGHELTSMVFFSCVDRKTSKFHLCDKHIDTRSYEIATMALGLIGFIKIGPNYYEMTGFRLNNCGGPESDSFKENGFIRVSLLFENSPNTINDHVGFAVKECSDVIHNGFTFEINKSLSVFENASLFVIEYHYVDFPTKIYSFSNHRHINFL